MKRTFVVCNKAQQSQISCKYTQNLHIKPVRRVPKWPCKSKEMLIFVAMLLSKNKIDYVLSHLQQHWLPSQRVEEAFVFPASNRPGPERLKAKIVFLLSEQEQPRPQTICFEGEELLVLFPLSSDSSPFELDERGTLWFRH